MIPVTEIKEYIDRSVLCWLATVSSDGVPNVSPKEIFKYYGDDKIIVANIASPQTVKNIVQNKNVCISFIDILVQKGLQIIGEARIVAKSDAGFDEMERVLLEMTGGHFPFATITEISIQHVKRIISPRHLLYPETKEEDQVADARRSYGLDKG